jgi:hypothetical protein
LQTIEFLSLEQGQSKQMKADGDVTPHRERWRRAHVCANRLGVRAAGPRPEAGCTARGPFPEVPHRPEDASRSPPSSSRVTAGRASTQRTAGRIRASPAVHSCRGRRVHLGTSPSIFWSPIKWSLPSSSRAEPTPRSCSPRTAPP